MFNTFESNIPVPPEKGEYHCTHSFGTVHQFEIYCGNTWIASLGNSSKQGWGLFRTTFVFNSVDNRITSQEDLAYILECIEFLNINAKDMHDHFTDYAIA